MHSRMLSGILWIEIARRLRFNEIFHLSVCDKSHSSRCWRLMRLAWNVQNSTFDSHTAICWLLVRVVTCKFAIHGCWLVQQQSQNNRFKLSLVNNKRHINRWGFWLLYARQHAGTAKILRSSLIFFSIQWDFWMKP